MPGAAEGPSVAENAPTPPETMALAASRLNSPFSAAASSVFSRASRAATLRSSRSSHLRLFWYKRVICVESSALSSAPTWSVPSSSAEIETSASDRAESSSSSDPNPPRSESLASSSSGSVASADVARTSAATDGGDAVPRLRSATSSPRTVRTSMAEAEASAAV